MTVHCEATLHYFDADAQALVPRTEPILDARAQPSDGWEASGFERIDHRSEVRDWKRVEGDPTHDAEIEALARRFLDCDAVLFYPPLLRSPERARTTADLAPVQLVHSDYTEGYRAMLEDDAHPYRAILAPSLERAGLTGEDIRRAKRIVTLQFWRNVGPIEMSHPLALCDARSVPRNALTPIPVPSYAGVRTEFESFAVAPPADGQRYRWCTFPRLRADELLVFRAYDSARAEHGEPFWTPHTAFADPTVPEGAPLRESVESRAICLSFG